MSLNDKETLPIEKSAKQKEIQVADMKNLAKIILIVATYTFLVEKKSLLNNKSTNHKKTNSKTGTRTSGLTSNTSFFLIWKNYWTYHKWMENSRCLVFTQLTHNKIPSVTLGITQTVYKGLVWHIRNLLTQISWISLIKNYFDLSKN